MRATIYIASIVWCIAFWTIIAIGSWKVAQWLTY